jgi:hypothetical protein
MEESGVQIGGSTRNKQKKKERKKENRGINRKLNGNRPSNIKCTNE